MQIGLEGAASFTVCVCACVCVFVCVSGVCVCLFVFLCAGVRTVGGLTDWLPLGESNKAAYNRASSYKAASSLLVYYMTLFILIKMFLITSCNSLSKYILQPSDFAKTMQA